MTDTNPQYPSASSQPSHPQAAFQGGHMLPLPYRNGGHGGQASYFDGGLLQFIGWSLLGGLLTAITFGIAYPWALCMIYNWETKHTVIEGRRLAFNGTGAQLFGNWIIWLLLTIITFGIYGFWVKIKVKQWIVKHTYFAV